ncbi:MAG: YgjP-like metallopeptidase domain-containing protein [Acidimicrobiia bacterium]
MRYRAGRFALRYRVRLAWYEASRWSRSFLNLLGAARTRCNQDLTRSNCGGKVALKNGSAVMGVGCGYWVVEQSTVTAHQPTPTKPQSVPGSSYDARMNELPVEVVRSKKRKRTVQAYISDGKVRVLVPAGLNQAEEDKLVETMVKRATRRLTSAGVDLEARARDLARRYGLPSPLTVKWSDRQLSRWGSCTPADGRLRISNRLAVMPGWVLDWVLIHELAHLEVSDHGERFQTLVRRYELGERAEGYLIAKSEEIAASRS